MGTDNALSHVIPIQDWRMSELARMGAAPRKSNDLVVSRWDVVHGGATLAGRVHDGNGAHPGMQAAEVLAEAGAEVELVTPGDLLR